MDVGSPLTVGGTAPALSRSHDRSAPASLLAPKRKDLRRTSTTLTMGACPSFCQQKHKEMLMSLCPNPKVIFSVANACTLHPQGFTLRKVSRATPLGSRNALECNFQKPDLHLILI